MRVPLFLLLVSFISLASSLCLASPATTLDGLRVAPGIPAGRISLGQHSFSLRTSRGLQELSSWLRSRIEGEQDSDEREILEELENLARIALDPPSTKDGQDALVHLSEIAAARANEDRHPIPTRVSVLGAMELFVDRLITRVGIGHWRARNLGSEDPASDPMPSTFWARPPEPIASRDLYNLFGRPLRISDQVCAYVGPKTSYGTNPGFEMKCGKLKVKVKFAGRGAKFRNPEVAITRLVGALGYNVEPNDNSDQIRVKWDPKIIAEFNSRKPLTTRVTVENITLFRFRFQKWRDPWRYVRYGVTHEGQRIPVDALKARLKELEPLLDHLVMAVANVQIKGQTGKNIGPWDFNRLGHPDRRELRGFGLLAAWTSHYDVRWDNTRLKFVTVNGRRELRHFLSDLGGSLGDSRNLLTYSPGDPNDLEWSFTRRDGSRMRFRHYTPMENNEPFRRMTVEDARWMARLIGQLTENQLSQALIAGGYASAEVKLFLEKLVSRRDQMVRDLGMTDEIPLLRPLGVDRQFDYDPRKDGEWRATTKLGTVSARHDDDLIVRDGLLASRATGKPVRNPPRSL